MSFDQDTGGLFNDFGLSLVQNADGSETLHERTTIREFFQARLVQAVADPFRVQSEPALPLQARPDDVALPALNIYTRDESAELVFTGIDTLKRELEMVVDCIGVKTSSASIERIVDSIAYAIEMLILSSQQDYPSCIAGHNGGSVLLESTEREFDIEGSYRLGRCRLTFRVTYYTALPEPPLQP